MKITPDELFRNKKKYIGKRINITRQGGKYHYDYQDKIMVRILTDVRRFRNDGMNWIEWHWLREPGEFTCGYSGIAEGSENLEGSYLNVLSDFGNKETDKKYQEHAEMVSKFF